MHAVLKIVRLVNSAIGTSKALEANRLLDRKDYGEAVRLKAAPQDYSEAHRYFADAQSVALLRKLEGLPTGVNLIGEAVSTFQKCEVMCENTNRRLARYLNWFERGFHGDLVDLRLYDHLASIRKLIGDVLGPIPTDLVPRLSGGSTFYDKGEEITIPHKMGARPSVTKAAWDIVRDLWKDTAWYRAHDCGPTIVLGNRFTTVRKDSTKDRGICVEPSLNVAYQLACGAFIRGRLLRFTGIDIKGVSGQTAQDKHRKLAELSSLSGLLATLDLSNASDTIAYMLVKLLLPRKWFDLLAALRSPYTRVGTKWVKLHKFSSMGNGFTFELETLIFWAIAKATSSGEVSAYGDDMILPAADAPDVVSLLTLLGFEVNAAKSFTDPLDPFRESCGGDFFQGQDVRPVYLRKFPQSPGEWMTLANQLTQMRDKLRNIANDVLLQRAWQLAVNQIPSGGKCDFRVFGPPWLGDCVIHHPDRKLWKTRKARGMRPLKPFHSRETCLDDLGFVEIKCLNPRFRKVRLTAFPPEVQLAAALLGTPSGGPVPRDGISGYKTAWTSLLGG